MLMKYNEYLHYVEAPAIKGVNKDIVLKLSKDDETTDMFYRDPTQDDEKFLEKYLRKNKFSLIELYHGTSSKNDIINGGLMRTKNKTKRSLQSTPGYVYLSVYENMAKIFGELAYPNDDITVYKVTIPVFFLKPDTDQLKNQNVYAGKNLKFTLANSALYGHAFRVKGDIPSYMIRKI